MNNNNNNDNRKPSARELFIVLSIALFLICVVAGGLARQHGYFDGTFMYDLFPAMVPAYVSAFGVALCVASVFPNAIPAWIISAIVTFAVMVPVYLWVDTLGLYRGKGGYAALILAVILGILCLIRQILRRL